MPSPIKNPYLALTQILDLYVRKNFEAIDKYFQNQNQFLDFQFFEAVFDAAETGKQVAHGLSYVPLDILVTRVSGTGKVTFRYSQFDETNLVLDADGPCRIRFYAGTYSRFTSKVQTGASDKQEWKAEIAEAAASASSSPTPLGYIATPLTDTQIATRSYPGSSNNALVGLYTYQVYSADATSANQTIKLPSASSMKGLLVYLKRLDNVPANTVTILPASGTDTIDGKASETLYVKNEVLTLFSTGTVWLVVDRMTPVVVQTYTPIQNFDGGVPSLEYANGNVWSWWYVSPKQIVLQGAFVAGRTVAGGGGSFWKFNLPNNLKAVAGQTGIGTAKYNSLLAAWGAIYAGDEGNVNLQKVTGNIVSGDCGGGSILNYSVDCPIALQ